MITYRLKGLLNLHILATALVATGYFLLSALGVKYLPWLDLNPDVNLLLYAAPILIGMLLSGRFWHNFSARFHIITWVDAARIASRQIVVVALLVFTLIVATKDRSISRLFLANYLISGWVVLVVTNRLLPAALSRAAFHKAHQLPTVFVGPSASVAKLNPWIHQKEHLGVRVAGILSDDAVPAISAHTGPHLGPTNRLAEIVEDRGIGQVILLEIPEATRMQTVVETCQSAGCRLLVYHNIIDALPVRMTAVMEEQHLFLTAQDEPLEDPFNRAIKRTFDIMIALFVTVVVLPPVTVAVWLMQRLQAPGPIVFARGRGGQRGRQFNMLKFRSMYVAPPNAEYEARQATKGDARIYPFGGFLRRTSLDEIPQFWNVLVGEMSVVGPRPHLPKHDDEFRRVAKTYRTRQLVKPGITGLAQVSGYRGEISDPAALERRVQLDIQYITTWSIWLDVQITMRTIGQIFGPPGTAR